MDVTFETKCWENDYRLMLQSKHLASMIENCNYDFKRKQLIINNVNDERKVKSLADKCVRRGVIDDVYLVSECAENALESCNIAASSFEGGYLYSISELVGICMCNTKYLLHFSSDSYIPREFKDKDWINKAIDIMESDSNIIAANPTWNYSWDGAKRESTGVAGEHFWLSQGFSDQCYLINTEVFKGDIYGCTHPDSERYPKYGGNLFEKRIDAYMRTVGKYRITSKDAAYVSRNIGRKQVLLECLGIKRI